jgi:hypothetical protein
MPIDADPATPHAAYCAIIDRLARQTPSIGARLATEEGRYTRGAGLGDANALVASLDPAQRRVLAEMLDAERRAAIHDVLAELSGWIACGGVELTYRGVPMPVDQSGMGLHGDYVGRLDGWAWPSDVQ